MGNFGEMIRVVPARPENTGLILASRSLATSERFTTASSTGFDPERIRKSVTLVVTAIIDSSSSMSKFTDQEGKVRNGPEAIRECHAAMREDLIKGENPRHQVVLGEYDFHGMLHPYQFPEEVPPINFAADGDTPLYDTIKLARQGSLETVMKIRERGISCREIMLIISDGEEYGSTHTSLGEVRELIDDLLSRQGNFVFGVGMGPAGVAQLRQLGIPEEMIRDVTKGLGIQGIFREFTSMTTQGRSPLSRSMSRRNS